MKRPVSEGSINFSIDPTTGDISGTPGNTLLLGLVLFGRSKQWLIRKIFKPHLSIPDSSSTFQIDTINIENHVGSVTEDFNVDVEITHTYIGDLEVYLEAPNTGTEVYLHARSGGSSDNIIGNYPETHDSF